MISIEKWAGLVTNASPYSLPPGSAVTQVNLQCLSPGQLNVRAGLAAATFSSHTGSTSAVLRAFCLPTATEAVVYQNADGEIRVARGLQ